LPLATHARRKLTLHHSINHRYMVDLSKAGAVLFFFVNLSDYPVRSGFCQADTSHFSK